jgi:hypothetical protein
MSRVKHLLGAALVVPIAVLATAASASASVHHPGGAFARFAQCPTENPAVEVCTYGASGAGSEMEIGDDDIPLAKPEIFQGGYSINSETGKETFVNAVNGETLVKVAQRIPAGFLANVDEGRYPWYFRNFCKHFPENSECKLTSTAELAGQPVLNTTNLIVEEGVALELPIKFHIQNPFLGNKCYLGSDTNPIVIHFTTGITNPPPPNLPVHGSGGQLEVLEEGTLALIKHNTLIDNTFPVPVVTGCGGPQSLVVDREFDEKNELPLLAGESELRFNGELGTASAAAVKASE